MKAQQIVHLTFTIVFATLCPLFILAWPPPRLLGLLRSVKDRYSPVTAAAMPLHLTRSLLILAVSASLVAAKSGWGEACSCVRLHVSHI
jgi:hypothetical protein